MKKFFLLAAIACLGTSAFAQKDTKELGVGLVFGTQVESAGLNVRGQYFVTDNVRLEGSVNYFFKHSGVSMWDLSANGAYVFRINDKFRVYPMMGFTFTSWSVEYSTSKVNSDNTTTIYVKSDNTVRFGANYGGGVEYALSKNVSAFGEIREQVLPNSYSQGAFTLGLKARF